MPISSDEIGKRFRRLGNVEIPVPRTGLCKDKASETCIVRQRIRLFETKREYEGSTESC
jgi:hypothetical protein